MVDKKKKSKGDPHGRTKKEKVKDFIKGTGLSHKQKLVRDAIVNPFKPSTYVESGKSLVKELIKDTKKLGKLLVTPYGSAKAKGTQGNRNDKRP